MLGLFRSAKNAFASFHEVLLKYLAVNLDAIHLCVQQATNDTIISTSASLILSRIIGT